MLNQSVSVIGAGPGGLAIAMQLLHKGYQVDIYEKASCVGGRTSRLTVGDYHFDLGPTFYMMPSVLEEVFFESGREIKNYIEMTEIDPLYTLKFGDVEFQPSRNHQKTYEEIERIFPGNGEGYWRFLKREGKKFEVVSDLLRKPFGSLKDYTSKEAIRALPHLDAFETVYSCLSKYFSDERLKWAFSFQSKYLGMSAWECPGTFTMLSYLEHSGGLFHPTGGVSQVSEKMADVVLELGGTIHLNTPVKRVLVEGGKAVGVELENGQVKISDDVVINADFGYAVTHLFDQKDLKRYKKEKVDKKGVSLSTFMLYLGVDRPLDIPHHMILFAEDYEENVKNVTSGGILSNDDSIYVHNPSKLDATLAPSGKSSLYILVPVPNLEADIDWEKQSPILREKVLNRLEKEPGLADLRQHIEVEKVITPKNWQDDYNVYKGATFNLAHNLSQMMYFRPHNKFDDVDHVFLVGGGTHPGSGLPTIYQSALISARLLDEQYVIRN
ncbi:phytoene desaturase [Halolactibacillus alkaliphilus]|uniref:Phytoene desaturase n=1 Tax=Halolactibacillus alkaliphilus TaxID=442899 RepID=A0A511X3H4_9BACI|nr:phytoene desaturase family protein [Halolactibacillus alkaliphilus]GEN57498.1 phytoene desaturase [Halolactibacillus alkaliphilus]GGN74105.1 phytoene desaturase [Halolactibacillus alkaliphilus]SFP00041.1 phytoene desaturase [Halolactibacillus alkaliphilus]